MCVLGRVTKGGRHEAAEPGVGGGQECVCGLGRAEDSGSVTTSSQPRRGTPFSTPAQQTLTSPPPLLLTLLWPASILARALPLPHLLPSCPCLTPPACPRNPRPAMFYPRGHTQGHTFIHILSCRSCPAPTTEEQAPGGVATSMADDPRL